MARGRMIDKRVRNSKKLGMISDKAARLYFMIYPHLDKKGRIAFDDLDDLMVEIIPVLKGWSLKKAGQSLNELADVGLIKLYPDKQKIAIQFERFEDFQTIRDDREAASIIATPEDSGVFRITPALSLSLMNELIKSNEDKIFFSFDKAEFINITEKDKSIWGKAYPACDIELELNKMVAWLIANPINKKSNYKRFISGWLSRQQDGGGTKKGSCSKKTSDMTPEEYNEYQKKHLGGGRD